MAFIDLPNVEVIDEASSDAKVLIVENGEIKRTAMPKVESDSNYKLVTIKQFNQSSDADNREIGGLAVSDENVYGLIQKAINDNAFILDIKYFRATQEEYYQTHLEYFTYRRDDDMFQVHLGSYIMDFYPDGKVYIYYYD